ncbi:hypothetical protein CHS0354_022266, partial [Potamilus streckersoni]
MYPPLSLPTNLTSSTRTSSTPRFAPVFQPTPYDVLIDLTPPTPTSAAVFQPSRDLTSLQPVHSIQFHSTETISPVPATSKYTLFPERPLIDTQNFPAVTETKTFTVPLSSLDLPPPEHYSRSVNIFGNNRSAQT